jgi:hypothetical protein
VVADGQVDVGVVVVGLAPGRELDADDLRAGGDVHESSFLAVLALGCGPIALEPAAAIG